MPLIPPLPPPRRRPLKCIYNIGQKVEKSIFQFILKYGSPDTKRKALYDAVKRNEKDKVHALLLSGLDVKEDYYPLELASARGHVDIVRMLLDSGCFPGGEHIERSLARHRGQALDLAVWKCDMTVVKLLVEAGMDWAQRNQYGETLMFVAACGNSATVAEYLIQLGCNMDSTTRGFSPLHVATQRCHFDAQKVLIRHGCNLNIPSARDCAVPLFFAIATEQIENLKHLFIGGCNVDLKKIMKYEFVQVVFRRNPEIEQLVLDEVRKPKPLMELCRKTIRKYISPGVVAKSRMLPIPRLIREYINMSSELSTDDFQVGSSKPVKSRNRRLRQQPRCRTLPT